MVLLLLVVCTGFAALAGRTVVPSPGNFSSFHGPGTARTAETDPAASAAGYALALLQVLYSYSGWENANYVLTEVRDAPRTLRKAAPLAAAAITLLYVLANIAYVWNRRVPPIHTSAKRETNRDIVRCHEQGGPGQRERYRGSPVLSQCLG